MIADTEEALLAHWSHLGRWPRGRLHDEGGLVWFETPIRHLPYNGVRSTRLGPDATTDATITAVLEGFRARGAACIWFVHPSATPSDLGQRLTARGLRAVERATCMSLELDDWQPSPLPAGVVIEEVLGDAAMETYCALNARYWEIPEEEQELVAEMQRYHGPGRVSGHRFLAYRDGKAIGKAYVSLAGPPGVASIYGMSVLPEARGRGVAGGLTTTLLRRALELGCSRAVLHSSDMAAGVYRRAGFAECGVMPVFATGTLWSADH